MGERQILCYVRTIINNPKDINFDEATSKIDIKQKNASKCNGKMTKIRNINHNCT